MEVSRMFHLRQTKIILHFGLITLKPTFQSSQIFRSAQRKYYRLPHQKFLRSSLGFNIMDMLSLNVEHNIKSLYTNKIVLINE